MQDIFLSYTQNTTLFRGIAPEDIKKMAGCLGCRSAHYEKGEPIARCGETLQEMGLVLSGSVRLENTDLWGNTSILSIVETGDVFAEAYACLPAEPLLVDVVANKETSVLFIHIQNLFNPCAQPCFCHMALIRNLITISAKKNLDLAHRIFDTAAKTIRGRLISYFSREVRLQGSNQIVIPFNRQQLADYLSIDRSALSNELSKMKKDRLIDYTKNRFTIHIHI